MNQINFTNAVLEIVLCLLRNTSLLFFCFNSLLFPVVELYISHPLPSSHLNKTFTLIRLKSKPSFPRFINCKSNKNFVWKIWSFNTYETQRVEQSEECNVSRSRRKLPNRNFWLRHILLLYLQKDYLNKWLRSSQSGALSENKSTYWIYYNTTLTLSS